MSTNLAKLGGTIFIDIDGVILLQDGNATHQITNTNILPGVLDKFNEWCGKSLKIVLTTARKESSRQITEAQLHSVGLFWDHLIMGLGTGRRFLINDLKPNNPMTTAIAVNLERNKGMEGLDLYANT